MSFGGFRFRLRRAYADGRLHPLVIVAVCLVVAVLLTLIVGNLLNIWMNDDLYQRLTGETETEPPAAEEEPTVVRRRLLKSMRPPLRYTIRARQGLSLLLSANQG